MPVPGTYIQKDLKEEDSDIMAEVEHNRWNIERLLLGFHPIKEEDIPAWIEEMGLDVSGMTHKDIESVLKGQYFTHPMIVPNSSLKPEEKYKDKILDNLDFLFRKTDNL